MRSRGAGCGMLLGMMAAEFGPRTIVAPRIDDAANVRRVDFTDRLLQESVVFGQAVRRVKFYADGDVFAVAESPQ